MEFLDFALTTVAIVFGFVLVFIVSCDIVIQVWDNKNE